ncbi:MAG: hypothetical protein MN733_34540, partial [Nitrososphaera sp.]|nr:hypothetical protein [Nitrososphaera sp.]
MDFRDKILACGKKFSAAITGGGTLFFHEMLGAGGASAVFTGGIIPYDSDLFVRFTGERPEKFCSRDAAVLLATAAFKSHPENDFGLGVTATLRKNGQEREGRRHFYHIAIRSKNRLLHTERDFSDKSYTRVEQEEIVALTALDAVGYYLDLYDKLVMEECAYDTESATLFERSSVLIGDGERKEVVVFPGSFNPFHAG